jgi:hypothetical protein
MVAKGVFTGTKHVKTTSVAFGDFPATPVGLPTQRFSLSGGGNEEPTTPLSKAAEQKSSELSGGNGVSQAPFPSFYIKNEHGRSSFQSRRPEAGMSPVQLLELRATELAIKRVDLAIQEQRNVGFRLEAERERDRRLAASAQHEQQQPAWDAAFGRQKLRVDEQRMRLDEQHVRLQLAELQKEPASAPPVSCGDAPAPEVPPSDGQYRAMAAALQLKCAQMRAGIERDELADSALIRLGAADPQAGIAAELRRQAELRAELEKAMAFNVDIQAERVHSAIGKMGQVGPENVYRGPIAKGLENAFKMGRAVGTAGGMHYGYAYSEVTRHGPTDQNPPSGQWGDFGWPVQGRFWA